MNWNYNFSHLDIIISLLTLGNNRMNHFNLTKKFNYALVFLCALAIVVCVNELLLRGIRQA